MEDDHERSRGDLGRPGEISPYNPGAARGPNGIWNEETLPVMEWEAAEHRVVVPLHLQQSLLLPTPVLRWAGIKYRVALEKHARDQRIVLELSRFLDGWQYHGLERGAYAGNGRILFPDGAGRWYALSIGPDRNGSYNVITIIGGSDAAFLANRLRGTLDIARRGE